MFKLGFLWGYIFHNIKYYNIVIQFAHLKYSILIISICISKTTIIEYIINVNINRVIKSKYEHALINLSYWSVLYVTTAVVLTANQSNTQTYTHNTLQYLTTHTELSCHVSWRLVTVNVDCFTVNVPPTLPSIPHRIFYAWYPHVKQMLITAQTCLIDLILLFWIAFDNRMIHVQKYSSMAVIIRAIIMNIHKWDTHIY